MITVITFTNDFSPLGFPFLNKQEQDQEKKKQEEEELKLDVTELRRRKEAAALAEAHENSKTAHFSRLGANFVPGRDILSAAARGTTSKGPI